MNQLRRWLWRARQTSLAVGWPGWLAALLLALTAAVYFGGLVGMREASGQLQRELATLKVSKPLEASRAVQQTPAEQLATFYGFFPEQSRVNDVLEKIYAAAPRQGLTLDQGEYRLVPASSGPLVRYEIVLPVKGTYLQVRQFMADILKDNPSLALQGVSFARDAAARIGIDAQLRLTLYLRRAA